MPNLNGTGPQGNGAMTGRKNGNCTNNNNDSVLERGINQFVGRGRMQNNNSNFRGPGLGRRGINANNRGQGLGRRGQV